jgi:Zn-dependent protease
VQFDQHWLAERLFILIPLWLSLSVHEWAHAWTAWRLGDDTAARLGRMSLNPLVHIDPLGTLILPLLGVPFGWAKPVPVQPHRFHSGVSMRGGMMRVAVAGPISNLVLAVVCTGLLAALFRFWPPGLAVGETLFKLLYMMVFLNVALAMFNALPIPPLDGSRVVDALVPESLRPAWHGFCQLGPLALGAVIILPAIAGFSLFAGPMGAVQHLLHQLMMLVNR